MCPHHVSTRYYFENSAQVIDSPYSFAPTVVYMNINSKFWCAGFNLYGTHNFFYGAVHILPNKIYVPGLLTGRRKRRRSEEIVTGIYVPARGQGRGAQETRPVQQLRRPPRRRSRRRGQGRRGLLGPASPLI